MSKRYSGKSFKDSSVMKKAKLSLKEKRKLKKDKKKNKWSLVCIKKIKITKKQKLISNFVSVALCGVSI